MEKFTNYCVMLNEAVMSSSNYERNLDLAADYLGRKLGKKLSRMPKIEQFHNAYGHQSGLRYIIDGTTNAIRFNLDRTYGVTSIDYWGKNGSAVPTFHVNVKGISLVSVLPGLAERMKDEHIEDIYAMDLGPKAGVAESIKKFELRGDEGMPISDEESKEMLVEKVVEIDGVEYASMFDAAKELLKKKISVEDIMAKGVNFSAIYRAGRELGIATKVPVVKGSPEEAEGTEIAQGEKLLEETKYADPSVIFDDIEKLTQMIVKGYAKSFILAGQSGIGKTHTVTKVLKNSGLTQGEGKDWVHYKGFSTPRGLYMQLFKNRTGIIVYDDCDSVLKDPIAINLLKGALDSYDERVITWGATRGTFNLEEITDENEIADLLEAGEVPGRFNFEGEIIFISNLPLAKIDKAVVSRASAAIDLWLKSQDIILRMKSILHDIVPDASMNQKELALDILEKNVESRKKELNFRTLINAIGYVRAGFDNAEELIARYA